MSQIAENLEKVQAQIAAALQKCGRKESEVELIAVSKTCAPEMVREAQEAGAEVFGESRVQEAKAKIGLLPNRIRWQFIGHLQKNKIRASLPLFELFHSMDSLALAQDMNRIAQEEGLHPRVLLEVNLAGEASKWGFSPSLLESQMEQLLQLERLQIQGLMVIPPIQENAEASRAYFVQLRELRDQLEQTANIGLPELSMGMSHDYPIAIEEGATLVRVGTAIFGSRVGKKWSPN